MAQLVGKVIALAKTGAVVAKPKLQVLAKYAKVELVPPTVADIPAIRSGLSKIAHSAKTGAYKNLTVREAWTNTLVAVEIYCWFFIGECIGKRALVGYNV